MNNTAQFDLLVIGGGINGAGIARDAAGRGLKVLLVEQNDLASATSSRSSKLVHGGLRYLETWQFRLVRESLQEREILLRNAPHIIWPLRFILPHVPAMRPRWVIQAGLWLYDHLGGPVSLPPSRRLDLAGTAEGAPLRPELKEGFSYSDCWVEDSRLVVLNAMDAAGRGAVVRTQTKLIAAVAEAGHWLVRLSGPTGQDEVRAKVVVNAAGPWVGDVPGFVQPGQKPPVRLIKGSHIVVPRIHAGDWAYLCQNDDGRVVFLLPFEQDFTLIGTTDVPYSGNPALASCSEDERDYLLRVASRFLRVPPSKLSIVHSFAGVRALYDNGAQHAKDITRDYTLTLTHQPAPVLSIYGGKITTFRRLAEHALDKLAPLFPGLGPQWTAHTPLPGGDIGQPIGQYTHHLTQRWPWLPVPLLTRWVRQYGTRITHIVETAADLKGLGTELIPGLYEAEADYLRRAEFALTLDDVLWRRTRLGLRLTAAQVAHLAREW